MTVTDAPTRPKPIPPIFKVNHGFWEGSKIGELRLDHCTECDHIWFPPTNSCPKCLSTERRLEDRLWTRQGVVVDLDAPALRLGL